MDSLVRSLAPALAFGAIGAALALGSLVAFVRKRARLAGHRRAPGTVAGFRVRHTTRDGRRRTYHHAQIRFDADGRAMLHESPIGTSEPRREVGDGVVVLYDPAAPDDACVDEVREKYFVPMLVGAIGVVFCGVAAWLAAR